MQRILIVSTLPQGGAADAAVRDLVSSAADYKVIWADKMNIHPCIGCNDCWLKTPGRCAIRDDYEELLKAYLHYDTILYLSGTALGFVHHPMKNIVDRILPLATMYTCFVDGQMRHVPRYQKSFRFALLYEGEADRAYLSRWLERVALNMHGTSLGTFPLSAAKEAALCI